MGFLTGSSWSFFLDIKTIPGVHVAHFVAWDSDWASIGRSSSSKGTTDVLHVAHFVASDLVWESSGLR